MPGLLGLTPAIQSIFATTRILHVLPCFLKGVAYVNGPINATKRVLTLNFWASMQLLRCTNRQEVHSLGS